MPTRTARRAAFVLIALLVASFVRCAPVTTQSGPTRDERVTLAVQNHSWCSVTIYRLRFSGSQRVRIGNVEAMGSEIFRMGVDDGSAQFQVEPFACPHGNLTTERIQVVPGARIRLTVPPNIPTTYLS